MYDFNQLNAMLVPELKDLGEKLKVKNAKKLKKQDLVLAILDIQAANPSAVKEIKTTDEPAPTLFEDTEKEKDSNPEKKEKRKRTRKVVNKNKPNEQPKPTEEKEKTEKKEAQK
ncbi:MAG: Rho termination factor N-terminal domain-containing protein, partial [Chitinophagales bacterium]